MPSRQKIKRAMVVVAHADDAEFGCSGTVARWCSEGTSVVYVLCTDGSKGSSDPKISSKELANIRRKEQEEAGKILGLNEIVFLDYPDSYLQPTLDLRKDIAREIRRAKPEILICQNPIRTLSVGRGSGHPDHIAAGESALSAVFPTARDRLTFPDLLEEGLEPHNVSEVWIMGTDNPDWWIDISKYMNQAIKSLEQHTSQVSGREVAERLKDGRRRVGKPHGMEYGEAFKRLVFN